MHTVFEMHSTRICRDTYASREKRYDQCTPVTLIILDQTLFSAGSGKHRLFLGVVVAGLGHNDGTIALIKGRGERSWFPYVRQGFAWL